MSDPSSPDRGHAAAWAHNARLGLWLFGLYLAFYGLFIWLSAFARDVMARPSLGGVNLATVYGFALIFGAFLLALVYMVLCRSEPDGGVGDGRPEPTEAEVAAKAVEEEGGA